MYVCTTVDRRDYGCPCEHNHQCKSDYCQDTSCADDIIQGVVAMDIHYHTLEELVRRVVQQHSPHNFCGQKYGCAENPVVICETRYCNIQSVIVLYLVCNYFAKKVL